MATVGDTVAEELPDALNTAPTGDDLAESVGDDSAGANTDTMGQLGHHGAYDDMPYSWDSDPANPYLSQQSYWQRFIHAYSDFMDNHGRLILILIILFLVVSSFRFRKDLVQNWWRRRKAAARYKRAKKQDGGDYLEAADSSTEDDPSVWETFCQSFTKDKGVECMVDLGDGKTQKIDAQVGQLEKVSELPFMLQEACRYSGNGQLAALSLVDLWLRDRARLQFTDASGAVQTVDKETTPSMLRRAKGFKVTILPQATR